MKEIRLLASRVVAVKSLAVHRKGEREIKRER